MSPPSCGEWARDLEGDCGDRGRSADGSRRAARRVRPSRMFTYLAGGLNGASTGGRGRPSFPITLAGVDECHVAAERRVRSPARGAAPRGRGGVVYAVGGAPPRPHPVSRPRDAGRCDSRMSCRACDAGGTGGGRTNHAGLPRSGDLAGVLVAVAPWCHGHRCRLRGRLARLPLNLNRAGPLWRSGRRPGGFVDRGNVRR